MAKDDILLRALINLPLVTKGSELVYDDLDGNWITLYNELVALSKSSLVPLYSAAITYQTNEYSTYDNQNWKMISGSPQINITPGTNPAVWLPFYPSDMIKPPLVGGASILRKEVEFSSVEILSIGVGTVLELIPNPGAGKYINLIQSINNLNFVSAFYEGASSLGIGFTSALLSGRPELWALPEALRGEVDQVREFERIIPIYSFLDEYIIKNDSISLTASGGGLTSPILGDGTIKIVLTYTIEDL